MSYTYIDSTLRGKQRIPLQETPQRGAAVLTTTTLPNDDIGEDGDVSINTSNWVLHGPKDTSWLNSPARSISKTRIWFNGERNPLISDGNDGDVWIFVNSGGLTLNFFQKTLGVWTEMINFTVPTLASVSNSSSGGGDGGDGGGGE